MSYRRFQQVMDLQHDRVLFLADQLGEERLKARLSKLLQIPTDLLHAPAEDPHLRLYVAKLAYRDPTGYTVFMAYRLWRAKRTQGVLDLEGYASTHDVERYAQDYR